MKESSQLSYFTLVIHPDERIIGRVKDLKAYARKILKRRLGSINSLAHITLIAFFAYDEDYPRILEEFKRVLSGLEPFMVRLSGFGSFKNSSDCTFFVRPTDETSEIIIQRCVSIHKLFCKKLLRERIDRWKVVGRNRPHMTVVREASLDDILTCEREFIELFEDCFFCRSFVLRKFNLHKGQFDIIDEILLLGHDYIAGEQIRLF